MNVKPDVKEETEEQKEQKHKTFVEKYEKEIKHFGESFSHSLLSPFFVGSCHGHGICLCCQV
jgi:hypothetical protein